MKKMMKKLLSFMLVILMVMQITPLELFAANGGTAITLIDIDLDSVVVGEKSPTSIYNSSNTYDITQVEWSCLYDNSFKAGDVFKEDSTYYLTFRVKAKSGYYLPVSQETGEYTGFYYINGDYNAKVCYTEGDEFVVRVKFVTNNIINNIYINLDYSEWTSFSVGQRASVAQQQFFESVYSIPEEYQNKYYIDEECCGILYENSTGVLNQLDYGHVIKNEYNYYMEYWVEALPRYDFDSDASNINVYINGVEVETKKVEYDSSWDAYVIDVLINVDRTEELTSSISSNGMNFVVGDNVTIDVLAEGGSGIYKYSYIVYNEATNQWARLADCIDSNKYTWKAISEGTRKFYVEVTDSNGTTVKSNEITITVAAGKEDLSITAKTSATNVNEGSTVTFTAVANGGTAPYKYSYIVYNETTNQWARLADCIDSNEYTWKAISEGTRKFYIEVVDADGKVVRSNALTISTNSSNELKATAKTSATNVNVGSSITLSATATGGSGSYTYSYIVYNKTTDTWFRLEDCIKESTYTWTATSEGTRIFYVDVKDSTGKIVRCNGINVLTDSTSGLNVKGETTSSSISVGETVMITGTAVNGVSPYSYSFIVYNHNTNEWYRFPFGATNILNWTAKSKGKRTFYVEAKDAKGNIIRASGIDIDVN